MKPSPIVEIPATIFKSDIKVIKKECDTQTPFDNKHIGLSRINSKRRSTLSKNTDTVIKQLAATENLGS